MNESLEKRIQLVREYLDEELRNEAPKHWWQYRVNSYIPTKEMDNGQNYHPLYREKTIVKFNVKRALVLSALFFTVNLLIFFFITDGASAGPADFWITYVLMSLFVALPMVTPRKGVLIAFSSAGFKVGEMRHLIPWKHLVASYIREDYGGEETSYCLSLYYYNKEQDAFEKIECSLHGLDMSKEEIASQVEFWKTIAGATT